MLTVEPVVLEGERVRLEPLELRHAGELVRHASPRVFQFMALAMPKAQTAEALEQYIRDVQAVPATVPFAIVLRETGEAIGVTTYLDIRPAHRGLEIGMTWVSPEFQGTAVNPECKFLLLWHAFEVLGCERVQLKTDGRNLQSQRAIEKLGAVKEGVLRRHMVMPDGYVRDTVMYSVVTVEWEMAKALLVARLGIFETQGTRRSTEMTQG